MGEISKPILKAFVNLLDLDIMKESHYQNFKYWDQYLNVKNLVETWRFTGFLNCFGHFIVLVEIKY